MAISKKVINFLERAKIKYELIEHRTVYTAYDKAATLKAPQKIIGKTLVVKLEKAPALVLIPANKNLDTQKLKKIAKVKKFAELCSSHRFTSVREIDFLKEAWMKKNLKGVKIGAIPPFGNLWQLSTFAERSLINLPKLIINGGDYNFSIKLKGNVLKKLMPDLVIGSFSKARK